MTARRPSAGDVEFAKETLIVLRHFPAKREDAYAQAAQDLLMREAQAILRRAAFRVIP